MYLQQENATCAVLLCATAFAQESQSFFYLCILIRHELPAEQVAPLRGQLFEHVVAYATGPKMILTRICVAVRFSEDGHKKILNKIQSDKEREKKIENFLLRFQLSAFVMQTIPEVWPDAVQGIISTFQQQNLPQLQVGIPLSFCLDDSIVVSPNSSNIFLATLAPEC